MTSLATSPRCVTERGIALIAVVFMALVLAGLSAAFLTEGLGERTSLVHHETSLQALQTAETGAIRGEMEVLSLSDADDDGIGTVSGTFANGNYDVRAVQDPTLVDRWVLTARGSERLSVRRIEIGLRRRAGGRYIEGLFSREDLGVNGSVQTDSYDSRTGTWDAQAVNVDAGGRHARGRGHVGSNMGIDLKGTKVHIRGNAIAGPMHETTTSGNPTVWGDRVPRTTEVPIESPTYAEFEAALASNNNGELLLGGEAEDSKGVGKGLDKKDPKADPNTGYDPATYALEPKAKTEIVLSGGTYFFTSMTFTAQTKLIINGPTIIYVTDSIDMAGGCLVNASGKPSDLQIIVHPHAVVPGHNHVAGDVKLTGGTGIHVALYAPDVDFTLRGNADLFGAVVGRTIDVKGNAAFHYDEALGDLDNGGEAMVERIYWVELSTPPR